MKKGYLIILVLCIVIAFASFVSAVTLVAIDTDGFVRGDLITISSFIIDLVALIVSLYVFFSIDAVNKVTSMDGNVLENERYSLAYASETRPFAKCQTQEEFAETLFSLLDKAKHKTRSCIDYADNLQLVIDKIIWFAYIDIEKYQSQWDELFASLNTEREKYVNLSSQLRYLFDENVNLIDQVNICQEALKAAADNKTDYLKPTLDDIRGNMLGNPITRIVYNDYLGLQYMLYAQSIVDGSIAVELTDFSTEYLQAVRQASHDGVYTTDKLIDLDVLISKAIRCFEEAEKFSRGNLLWSGYISFNLARMYVFHYCVFCGAGYSNEYRAECFSIDHVQTSINAAIESRRKLLALYRTTMTNGEEDNYLLRQFRDLELPLAIELKTSFETIIQA